LSGLVPFELHVGRQLSMKGARYEIAGVERSGAIVTLRLVEQPNTEHQISRDALANVIVSAEAVFIDEPEEPEPAPDREVTNLASLSLYRALDWFALMYLLMPLNSVAGSGPKSKRYQRAYIEAVTELKAWAASIGYGRIKIWSPWTLYRTLRRWRLSRYASSAVSRKGLQPAPWRRRSELHLAAEKIAKAIVMENPAISTSNLFTETNKRLNALKAAVAKSGQADDRSRTRDSKITSAAPRPEA
jgi:hypothetical protein